MLDANTVGTVSDLMQVKDRIEVARESLRHAHTTLFGQPETKIKVDQLDLGNTLRFMEQKLEKCSRAIQGLIDAIITASYENDTVEVSQ